MQDSTVTQIWRRELSTKDVAQACGKSCEWVRKQLESGRLKGHKARYQKRPRWVIFPEDLAAYEADVFGTGDDAA